MINLVAFAGFAGSGKDTAARCLIERGYTRLAFADALKSLALQVNPLVYYGYDVVTLREAVEWYGWDKAKGQPTVRRQLQDLGQSVRELDEHFWAKALIDKLDFRRGGPYVITDVRYPNEAMFCRFPFDRDGQTCGGLLVWVDRPGVGPCNGHESENPAIRDICDVVIVNDGTVEELGEKVLEVVDNGL